MGAGLSISPSVSGYEEKIKEFFNGEGPDLVIEAASSWEAIETCQNLVKDDGKIIIVSRHTDQPGYNPVGHPYFGRRQSIISSYGFSETNSRWNRYNCMRLTIQLLKHERLNVSPMITDRIKWNEIPDMYAKLSSNPKNIVGVIINWD